MHQRSRIAGPLLIVLLGASTAIGSDGPSTLLNLAHGAIRTYLATGQVLEVSDGQATLGPSRPLFVVLTDGKGSKAA